MQYESHLPAGLVWIHVTLGTLAWLAILWVSAVAGQGALGPGAAAEGALAERASGEGSGGGDTAAQTAGVGGRTGPHGSEQGGPAPERLRLPA